MSRRCFAPLALVVGSLLFVPAWAIAADSGKPAKPQVDAQQVELFEAIANKQIDVKFIPRDSRQANVMIANKTDKPLSVKLPSAFAAVPVVAQQAGGGFGGGAQQTQPAGGGFGGGGGMGGMGGGGGGMFNIAPEKVSQLKVPLVCLAHGKPEPRAAVPYEIRPLETVTDAAGMRETLAMLAEGQINQRAAQVATWHLCNGMSFEELAAKQIRYANGATRPYFSADEIRAGMQIASVALKAAEQNGKPVSGNESLSQR
jgi:hypothetical protein